MNQSIIAMLAALTIWLCANTAKTNTANDNSSMNTKIVAALMDRVISLEEQSMKEELPVVAPEVQPVVPEDNTNQ
jgi:ABC-type Fe3+-hydroxamate transport system substrate-binding protein